MISSDAARSWGGSAVLGVSPMSDCRGPPHERLHQDSDLDLSAAQLYLWKLT
ncbi:MULTISPECIES: hypothetical protein [Moorena]|uniref:hypothetical protein n=1 Tax=Moorena TaxID=1155738 RepID=UPI0002E4C59E|nr:MULTISPECIES: hypothetical protein [Moorena]